MKAIISHQNLDFDGLASMVACSKLNPDSFMFFTGKVSEEVKNFVSLYKNVLPVKQAGKLNLDEIDELFIVDVNTPNRIGKFKELLDKPIPITIIDHHEVNQNTIENAIKTIKPFGACTTILIQEIIKQDIPISTFEATLFALGIYTDTNCLTFNSTTYHDAEAVAFLLKKGANLSIIKEFMNVDLSEDQDQLFTSLLVNLELVDIKGYQIAITVFKGDNFIGDLGTMCEKLMEIKKCDAVFLLVEMENRCYIVGRSAVDEIHLPYILENFGGAGHPKAASATVKDGNLEELKSKLIDNMMGKIKSQLVAGDIMSYPVKTVFEDMTVDEVNKIMFRYGHTGMPVVKDNELIGIISRTDIDKGMIHGLSHAPVKGFMTRNVKTVDIDTNISEINQLLIKHNIGRLPVINNGKIVGIVTRTDLLKILYGKNAPSWYKKIFNDTAEDIDCKDLLNELPEHIYKILDIAGKVGDRLYKKVYVVGGFVRDLLLNVENWDIDLVVEGDGIFFARELNNELKGNTKLYQQFGTAMIELDNGQTIDIVTARREYYEYPAALPKIEESSIWSDLFRRDFTVNCMALQLNKNDEGKLIDYFGGFSDLKSRKIRVLYNLSFIEDPTRIFRAIRFASRFNFDIEDETRNFIEQALNQNMIQKLSDDRIKEEMIYILKEKSLYRSLTLMLDLNIFKSIDSELRITHETLEKIGRIDYALDQFKGSIEDINTVLVKIMLLLTNFPLERLHEVLNKFSINKAWYNQILDALFSKKSIYDILINDDLDKYCLYEALEPLPEEAILYYHIDSENPYIRHYLMYYTVKLKNIKPIITGEDLKKLNIKPGPIYKRIFDHVLEAKIKGLAYSYEDELALAKKQYEALKGEKNVSI
ncbi:CBS domain-containing protein [Alkaliphilus peptidifermentans]|uniref:tRNA nucleotidyltransferase (CCA-adding enzyme) n=1 Tax=Alkaliphilus peptidifermentans DSM 18978 TaxID=1120976 RepID=A0A1G5KEI9_9FIRM|nr:CBS domain-containing protein [Alkaliphilus peptidifermentans]SCY99045.1 tRNA nucleotidyltransferase (CCA-adding enzyme) [Alkaliphilus peptidifermentans DSM 18978]